jgi:hypothetical protein
LTDWITGDLVVLTGDHDMAQLLKFSLTQVLVPVGTNGRFGERDDDTATAAIVVDMPSWRGTALRETTDLCLIGLGDDLQSLRVF